MGNFNNFATVKFQQKMKPHALKIYHSIFPNCELIDLREKGVKVHILDKEYGIDSILNLQSGQSITIQEKYRDYEFLINPKFQVKPPWPDFTQEYKNAADTPYEEDGEWFKLMAQLYFYGWANRQQTEFEKWVMINILKYKIFVERIGGLHKIGRLRKNKTHGKASFYCIPIVNLSKVIWIKSYNLEIQTTNNQKILREIKEKQNEIEIPKNKKKQKVADGQLPLFAKVGDNI